MTRPYDHLQLSEAIFTSQSAAQVISASPGFFPAHASPTIVKGEAAPLGTSIKIPIPTRASRANAATSERLSSARQRATRSASASPTEFSTRSSIYVTTPGTSTLSSSTRQRATPSASASPKVLVTRSSVSVTTPTTRSLRLSSSTQQATTPSRSTSLKPSLTRPATSVPTPSTNALQRSFSARPTPTPWVAASAHPFALSSSDVPTSDRGSPTRSSFSHHAQARAPSVSIHTRPLSTVSSHHRSVSRTVSPARQYPWPAPYSYLPRGEPGGNDTAWLNRLSTSGSENIAAARSTSSTRNEDALDNIAADSLSSTRGEDPSNAPQITDNTHNGKRRKAGGRNDDDDDDDDGDKALQFPRLLTLTLLDEESHHDEFLHMKKEVEFHADMVIQAREENRVLEGQIRELRDAADQNARLEEAFDLVRNEVVPALDDDVARRRKRAARNLRWRLLTMVID